MFQVRREAIVVCWKTPKWNIDLATTAFTDEQLREHYVNLRRDPERAIASAQRQLAAREIIEQALAGSSFIPRGQFNRPVLTGKDLVVMAGGDNHAIWGIHFLPLEVPVVLLNSDYTGDRNSGSHGGILNFTAADFVETLPQILEGNIRVEEWTLLEVQVGDRPPVLTVSEVYLGERDATDFSGNHIEVGGVSFRHAGSGTIVATGAGTSRGSWFESAAYTMKGCKPARPTKRQMHMVNREHNMAREDHFAYRCASFDDDCTMRITSMNDSEGIVRIDSIKDHPFTMPFPQGEVATVRVAKETVRVVVNPLR